MPYTFVMFKPDALRRGLVAPLLEGLTDAGCKIELFDYRLVPESLICSHYEEQIVAYGEGFRQKVVAAFAGKAVIPVILSGQEEALIEMVRTLIGATNPAKAAPGTLRYDYGDDDLDKAMAEDRCCENLIHASDSEKAYRREAALWFGPAVAGRFVAKPAKDA